MVKKKNNVLQSKIIEDKPMAGGVRKRTIVFSKPNSQVSVKNVKQLVENLEPLAVNGKMLVRAEGIDRLTTTLKGLQQELHIEDYEEYYSNKVKDTGKFFNFEKVYITIYVNN